VGEAIGEILPLAVGVAISPIPVIAVILMLFSDRARSKGLAFLLGWIAGIAGGLGVLIAIASTRDLSTDGTPSDTVSWVKLVLAGDRVQPSLDRAKAWLSANNTVVMAVLLLVIGVTLIGKGLGGLT
jgi:hypothetical protein